jgi:hypothetical protein
MGIWPSGLSGGLARRRPGFESSAGTASIHLDVYPQRRQHSWDGYVRYIKKVIILHKSNGALFLCFIHGDIIH